MRAAILAVGTELLGSRRLDTNSLFLTRCLQRYGVDVAFKGVVGDRENEIAKEVARLVEISDVLLVTGGLGPTEDDRTREAVARALDRRLYRRQGLVSQLRSRFASFGLEMPAVNEKQADVIEAAEVLDNPRGTAPGQRLDLKRATIFLFPGVPDEAKQMSTRHLEPWLRERVGEESTETRVLRVACLPESQAEADLAPYYEEFGTDGFSILPSPGQINLQLTAIGDEKGRRVWLEPRLERLQELFAKAIFAADEETDLETAVGSLLSSAGATVATAESCTGGLVAERLTRVAGSSLYFLGGVVAYSNQLKTRLLGVQAKTLDRCGAVSDEVVTEMAQGARERLGADWALAVSGIAGPGGGSESKPVGTVHLAVANGIKTSSRALRLPGDRERIRWLASQWVLDMLRRRLVKAVA